MKPIPTYIVNLKRRPDRKEHILNEFLEKKEFLLKVVEAIDLEPGSYGFWLTVQNIVIEAKHKAYDYVLICEDDHFFTKFYNLDVLYSSIRQSIDCNADLLLGGVSNFIDAVQIRDNLFWINAFSGFQFVIVFESFYDTLSNIKAVPGDNIDIAMKDYSKNTLCCYPFISWQKNFGYSDVTVSNSKGVEKYFELSNHRLDTLVYLRNHFNNLLFDESL